MMRKYHGSTATSSCIRLKSGLNFNRFIGSVDYCFSSIQLRLNFLSLVEFPEMLCKYWSILQSEFKLVLGSFWPQVPAIQYQILRNKK